jgi:hypothetical protein
MKYRISLILRGKGCLRNANTPVDQDSPYKFTHSMKLIILAIFQFDVRTGKKTLASILTANGDCDDFLMIWTLQVTSHRVKAQGGFLLQGLDTGNLTLHDA